jgi:anti-anti-sigma regulatory factor
LPTLGNDECVTLLVRPPVSGQTDESHPFHSELHEGESICVVRVCGALVESAAAVFEQVVSQLNGALGRSVIVDASLLGEIDSQGVQKVRDLQRRVVDHGGKLVVYAASGEVAKALGSSSVLS